MVNDDGRSHQQSQSPFLREIEFRADAAHSRRVSQISDILKAVVAGKVREIAIAREVGDSVHYHKLSTPSPRSRLLARNDFRVARDLGVVERMLPSQVRGAIFTVGLPRPRCTEDTGSGC